MCEQNRENISDKTLQKKKKKKVVLYNRKFQDNLIMYFDIY